MRLVRNIRLFRSDMWTFCGVELKKRRTCTENALTFVKVSCLMCVLKIIVLVKSWHSNVITTNNIVEEVVLVVMTTGHLNRIFKMSGGFLDQYRLYQLSLFYNTRQALYV